MKLNSSGISPSGGRVLTLRVSAQELEILRGCLAASLQHFPQSPSLQRTRHRMRSMIKCLDSEDITRWVVEEGIRELENATRSYATTPGQPPAA